jgi:hypothetical protein
MLSRLQRAPHREEVNWAPQSDVMTAGTPKRLTHPLNSAFSVYCCGGGDRNCLRPAGCSVNDSEQVGEPLGGWQGAHKVHVDVAEMAGGYRDVLRRYLYMSGEPWLAGSLVPGGDEAAGRPPARVGGP